MTSKMMTIKMLTIKNDPRIFLKISICVDERKIGLLNERLNQADIVVIELGRVYNIAFDRYTKGT